MNPTPSGGPGDDPCDPIALNFAAARLEVYQHERLAYTEIPARNPKPKRPVSRRMQRLREAVYYWANARS